MGTADVKSAGGCIMSSNKLASYSYMIQGSSCQGIPSQDQQKYNEETQQCLKKETVQTPVTKIYEEKQTISQKHLSEEKDNKICISKERVNVCQSNSSPQEITQKKVQYFCISKDAINTLQALRELSLSQRNVKKSDLEYSQWIMRELNGTLLPLYTNQIATFLVIEFLNQE